MIAITLGGQEITTSPGLSLDVNVHPTTFEEFKAGVKTLLALDDSFKPYTINSGGITAWITRETLDESIEFTVFSVRGASEELLTEYIDQITEQENAS